MNYTDYFGDPRMPRGVRNNNPGNIDKGSPWQGLVNNPKEERFCTFKDAAFGIRAIVMTLITYYDKRKARDGSKIDSIKEVIERWAPENENDTIAYSNQIARVLAISPDSETLNLHNYNTMRGLLEGIIRHECGDPRKFGLKPYNNVNQWYPDEVIEEGLRRAGMVKPPVAASKTTVAAGGVAAVGAGQLLDVSQPVIDAIKTSQDNITSGEWVRIAFGLVTVGIGAWLAYVQYRKYKAGQSS